MPPNDEQVANVAQDISEQVQRMAQDQGVDSLGPSDPEFEDVLTAVGQGFKNNDAGVILRAAAKAGQQKAARLKGGDITNVTDSATLYKIGENEVHAKAGRLKAERLSQESQPDISQITDSAQLYNLDPVIGKTGRNAG